MPTVWAAGSLTDWSKNLLAEAHNNPAGAHTGCPSRSVSQNPWVAQVTKVQVG